MRFNWNIFRFAIIAFLAAVAAGCSGINASHSVSPATFLLPGLMQSVPQPALPEVTVPPLEPLQQVAQAQ